MQQNPPQIPADLMALSQPKFNGAWVFADDNNRKAWVTQKNIFLPRVGYGGSRQRKTAVNVGFARYVVPTSQSHQRNTLAACTWCSGFSPDIDAAADG